MTFIFGFLDLHIKRYASLNIHPPSEHLVLRLATKDYSLEALI